MTDQAIPSSKSVSISIGMAGTVSLEGLDELSKYAVSVTFRPDGAAVIFVKGVETRTHVFPIADMIRGAAYILQIAKLSADTNSARSEIPKRRPEGYIPKPDPVPLLSGDALRNIRKAITGEAAEGKPYHRP